MYFLDENETDGCDDCESNDCESSPLELVQVSVNRSFDGSDSGQYCFRWNRKSFKELTGKACVMNCSRHCISQIYL